MKRKTTVDAPLFGSRVGLNSFGVLLMILCCLCADDSQAQTYNVTKQTQSQMQHYAEIASMAAEASALATPKVLEVIDSTSFRQSIASIELFQNASAEFILSTLNETMALAYVTHGISPNNPTLDLTLSQLVSLNFLPNFWERWVLDLLQGTNRSSDVETLIFQNNAEVLLLGFPDFPNINNLSSITFEEAQNRVQYAALDIWRDADGILGFGSITLVLDRSYLANMVVLSPVDTGIYTTCCLIPKPVCTKPYPFTNWNCFGNVSLGTFDNFNHLYLPSEDFDYVSYKLSDLVNRLFADPILDISVLTESNYWEADIFGNVLFPDAVKFVIGDLIALFGQSQGSLLRDWCREMGWPLVWAKDSVEATWLFGKAPFNESFFDPTTLAPFSNVTADNETIAVFEKYWDSTNVTITSHPVISEYPPYWNKLWDSLYSSMPPELHLTAIRPGYCNDSVNCVGRDDNGNCFCTYSTWQEEEREW